MSKLSEKAKFIDMYSSLPALSFGKDGKVYSRLGLLLTLITIFIIGGMAIWIGMNIFGRQKPSFIQYDLPSKECNPKIKKAQEHLTEAFDLVMLAKKVIEIDKLKVCLLTNDQRVLFENLPSSVIGLNPDIDIKSPEAIKQYHWKNSFKGDEIAVRKAYSRLKGTKNQLDQLLIKLYEDEYIDDGARL